MILYPGPGSKILDPGAMPLIHDPRYWIQDLRFLNYARHTYVFKKKNEGLGICKFQFDKQILCCCRFLDPGPWSMEGRGSTKTGRIYCVVVLLGLAMSSVAILGFEELLARSALKGRLGSFQKLL